MKLSNRLENLSLYPFHMPGHKRNRSYNISSSEIDITEIDGFDNLHNPKELLKELEDELSRLYHSRKSIISVNGSTCCILAAISALCSKGDTIIIARNCHKSVYNACFINALHVVYIEPEYDSTLGIYTKISQQAVDTAVRNNPDAKAVVITSPTYEGIVSEIKTSVPLIIDSAHGSHFGFADYLPMLSHGDLVIHSLHKTLPCLTQCAVVHINDDALFNKVKRYMDIFETSSPSYVLLSSIDRCVDFLKDSVQAFASFRILLDSFYKRLEVLDNISILKNDDPTRIIISADGYTGNELADHLRANGVEPEGAGLNHVILIATVCDTAEGFEMLYNALKSTEHRDCTVTPLPKPSAPEKVFEQYEITDTASYGIDEAVNRICGESVFAYPPGIPIITAGERISSNIIDYIKLLLVKGVNVLSDSDLLPNSILTKSD